MSDDKCALCGYDWSNHISEAELTAAQQRNKGLEEAGDGLVHIITGIWSGSLSPSDFEDSRQIVNNALDNWQAALGGDE